MVTFIRTTDTTGVPYFFRDYVQTSENPCVIFAHQIVTMTYCGQLRMVMTSCIRIGGKTESHRCVAPALAFLYIKE